MYHIFKATRTYQGKPYSGPLSKRIPSSYKTFGDAAFALWRYYKLNPVGWSIYDSKTGNLIKEML